MEVMKNFRWRKVTDIKREHAQFELLDGDVPILDIGYRDDGAFEVAFGPEIVGRIFELKDLEIILSQGKVLADQDRQF